MICPFCGTKIDTPPDQVKFCVSCGKDLTAYKKTATKPTSQTPPQHPPGKRSQSAPSAPPPSSADRRPTAPKPGGPGIPADIYAPRAAQAASPPPPPPSSVDRRPAAPAPGVPGGMPRVPQSTPPPPPVPSVAARETGPQEVRADQPSPRQPEQMAVAREGVASSLAAFRGKRNTVIGVIAGVIAIGIVVIIIGVVRSGSGPAPGTRGGGTLGGPQPQTPPGYTPPFAPSPPQAPLDRTSASGYLAGLGSKYVITVEAGGNTYVEVPFAYPRGSVDFWVTIVGEDGETVLGDFDLDNGEIMLLQGGGTFYLVIYSRGGSGNWSCNW